MEWQWRENAQTDAMPAQTPQFVPNVTAQHFYTINYVSRPVPKDTMKKHPPERAYHVLSTVLPAMVWETACLAIVRSILGH